MSTTLENEAIATVENEATQTDWMGDLCGGLGSNPAAGGGRCSAASGRSRLGYRAGDGGAGAGVGPAAEVRAAGSSVPIATGEQEYHVTVNVVYELHQKKGEGTD